MSASREAERLGLRSTATTRRPSSWACRIARRWWRPAPTKRTVFKRHAMLLVGLAVEPVWFRGALGLLPERRSARGLWRRRRCSARSPARSWSPSTTGSIRGARRAARGARRPGDPRAVRRPDRAQLRWRTSRPPATGSSGSTTTRCRRDAARRACRADPPSRGRRSAPTCPCAAEALARDGRLARRLPVAARLATAARPPSDLAVVFPRCGVPDFGMATLQKRTDVLYSPVHAAAWRATLARPLYHRHRDLRRPAGSSLTAGCAGEGHGGRDATRRCGPGGCVVGGRPLNEDSTSPSRATRCRARPAALLDGTWPTGCWSIVFLMALLRAGLAAQRSTRRRCFGGDEARRSKGWGRSGRADAAADRRSGRARGPAVGGDGGARRAADDAGTETWPSSCRRRPARAPAPQQGLPGVLPGAAPARDLPPGRDARRPRLGARPLDPVASAPVALDLVHERRRLVSGFGVGASWFVSRCRCSTACRRSASRAARARHAAVVGVRGSDLLPAPARPSSAPASPGRPPRWTITTRPPFALRAKVLTSVLTASASAAR